MTTTNKEYTNDSEDKVASGAVKFDGGKSPIYRGFLAYFSRAAGEIARVSDFGASKYQWGGWRDVSNGIERYSDAMVRHLIAEEQGEILDPDSGLLHAAHCAWNALAVLELKLEKLRQSS